MLTHPSSKARNSVVEPESLDINIIVPIGMPMCNSFWATIIGPTVLVRRWSSKLVKELSSLSRRKLDVKQGQVHFGGSLGLSAQDLWYKSPAYIWIIENTGIEDDIINPAYLRNHWCHISNKILRKLGLLLREADMESPNINARLLGNITL